MHDLYCVGKTKCSGNKDKDIKQMRRLLCSMFQRNQVLTMNVVNSIYFPTKQTKRSDTILCVLIPFPMYQFNRRKLRLGYLINS